MPTNKLNSKTKAEELAQRIIAKASDESAKFTSSKASTVCSSCRGTAMRYVYQYGRRYVKRCEAAVWSKEKKRFICGGNPESEKIEQANRKDLTGQIWKIVMFRREKESFLLWLEQEYNTQSLSSFSLKQLEFVLNKVKAQSFDLSLQQVA